MWRPKLIVLQPTPYCNIDCDYCYLANRDDRTLMGAAVIAAIRDKVFSRIAADAAPTVIWHAGEPTVVAVDWYRRAHAQLLRTAPSGLRFSIQSNGVALSDAWVRFLRESGTHVGLSIDGPQAFHDRRRKTKSGRGTWSLAMAALERLQAADLHPSIVTVLHPLALAAADEFFAFYRTNRITHVSFSIDEIEGANATSSFGGRDCKEEMTAFLFDLLRRAFAEAYPLHIKEVERIAQALAGAPSGNEQVEPWEVVTIAANGDVTSFSPEFMETPQGQRLFRFGNVLRDDMPALFAGAAVRDAHASIRAGVEACRRQCKYFAVCGGGAPANKFHENGRLDSTETLFCRLSIQAAAEGLRTFVRWSASAAQTGARAPMVAAPMPEPMEHPS